MSFWKQAPPPPPAAPLPTPEEIAAREEEERVAALAAQRGDQFCSARSCKEETGLACSYVDRRDRACPTAWCPEHRVITHGKLYCPAHASFVDGTSNPFGLTASPDVTNRVPALLNWVTREVDADIRRVVEQVALVMHEEVVIEPVRFVLVGVERTRTWDRSWKTCSHFGIDLRIGVAIEEGRPDVVLGKVNSRVIVEMRPPWSEEFPVGHQPATPEAAEAAVGEFRQHLFMSLARAAEAWRVDEMHKRAAEFASLEGQVQRPSPASPG